MMCPLHGIHETLLGNQAHEGGILVNHDRSVRADLGEEQKKPRHWHVLQHCVWSGIHEPADANRVPTTLLREHPAEGQLFVLSLVELSSRVFVEIDTCPRSSL